MSFLLDALKKSEQERQQYHLPDLQTHHMSTASSNSYWHWGSIFVVVVILNVSLYFWFSPHEEQEKNVLVVPQLSQKILPETSASDSNSTTPLPLVHLQDAQVKTTTLQHSKAKPTFEQITPESIAEPTQTNRQTAKTESTPAMQGSSILTLEQLSQKQRQRIGAINISAHFYGRDQQNRIVMINGATWHEGQNIRPDLMIEQITDKGILFNHKGLRFSMKAFQELKL